MLWTAHLLNGTIRIVGARRRKPTTTTKQRRLPPREGRSKGIEGRNSSVGPPVSPIVVAPPTDKEIASSIAVEDDMQKEGGHRTSSQGCTGCSPCCQNERVLHPFCCGYRSADWNPQIRRRVAQDVLLAVRTNACCTLSVVDIARQIGIRKFPQRTLLGVSASRRGKQSWR